ncbi:MAG: hypothetical protein ACK4YP_17145, partial [Myxococcota bacterium]
CRFMCRDECLALRMIASCQNGLRAVAEESGRQLVEIDRVDGRVSARSQDRGALAAVYVDGEDVLVGQHDAGRILVGRLDDAGGATVAGLPLPAPVSCCAAGAPVFGLATGLVVRVEGRGPDARAVPLFHADAEVEGVEAVDAEGLVLAVDRSGTLTVLDRHGIGRVRVTGWGRRLKAVRFARVGEARLALCAGKDHRLHAVDLDDLARGAWEVAGSDVAQRTFNDLLVDGDRVYAASWDRRIHRLVLASPDRVAEVLPPLVGHVHAVERMLSVDGALVSVSYDGTLRGWPAGAEAGWSLSLSPLAVRRVARSPLPGHVVTAGYDGVVREVDLSTRTVTRTWRVA